MRAGIRIVLVLAVQLVGANLVPAQKVLDENPYYLRADPKLQVSLNVEADHPKLSQIVAKLRDVTGLDIEVDGGLQEHAPDYGVIQPSKGGYYAWQIMELVARKDLQHGYWEKNDWGYRLVGTSLATVAQPRPEGTDFDRLLSLSALLLAGLAIAIGLYYWKSGKSARRST